MNYKDIKMSVEKRLSNFIPISRDLFEHYLWEESRVYSRFEAWLYLLNQACQEENKTVLDRGNLIEIKKGQIYTSRRELSMIFRWSIGKTIKFIDLLFVDGMISMEECQDTKKSILTISHLSEKNKDNLHGVYPTYNIKKDKVKNKLSQYE